MEDSDQRRNFGLAWLLLCLALAAHVTDEALTGFLPVYNATVRTLRAEYSWYPMPTFEFRGWLTGLIMAVVVLLLLTSVAYRNARWLRPFGYFFAVAMLFNGIGHTLATLFGRTVSTIHFARPAPGFYSSPLLLAGAVYLLSQLLHSKRGESARSSVRGQ